MVCSADHAPNPIRGHGEMDTQDEKNDSGHVARGGISLLGLLLIIALLVIIL